MKSEPIHWSGKMWRLESDVARSLSPSILRLPFFSLQSSSSAIHHSPLGGVSRRKSFHPAFEKWGIENEGAAAEALQMTFFDEGVRGVAGFAR